MNLFITGGTGFIGKRVVNRLASQVDKIYLLVREKSATRAKKNFSNYNNIEYIIGDITQDDVIEQYQQLKMLQDKVDGILNIAGNYNLEITEFEAYKNNVIGVQNILNFAKTVKNLEIFHHISTYAVIGTLNGELSENDMDNAKNFKDFYAKSKMQGENILRNTELVGVKKRIYRPGIVTGSTKSGDIEKVDGPYYLMKFLYEQKELLKNLKYIKKFPLPFNDKAFLPLIPVDYLADWLEYAVLNSTDHKLRSYNFFGEEPVTIKNFTSYLLKAYGIEAEPMELKELGIYKHILPQIGMPKELLQYMYSEAKYSVENRKEDFPALKEYSMMDLTKKIISGSNKYFQEAQWNKLSI